MPFLSVAVRNYFLSVPPYRWSTVNRERLSSIFEHLDDLVAMRCTVRLRLDELHASERSYIGNSVQKRQAEFSSGRYLARCALAELGVEPCSILMADDRTPLWPEGIVGSISHSESEVLVAVGRRAEQIGIGIDTETRRHLNDELRNTIATPDECAAAATLLSEDDLAVTLFSCKEAVYKAVYPLTRQFLGFADVEIQLQSNKFSAKCVAQGTVSSLLMQGDGHFEYTRTCVRALFIVRHGPN